MNSEDFDDLALDRLSRPAALPGGLSRRRFLQLAGAGAGAATREYLVIEYAPSKKGPPGDRLYVPTDQLDQVTT